jgi:hypothetical protein
MAGRYRLAGVGSKQHRPHVGPRSEASVVFGDRVAFEPMQLLAGFQIPEPHASIHAPECACFPSEEKATQQTSSLCPSQMAIATTLEVWDQAGRKLLARGDIGGDPLPIRPGKYQVRVPKTDARPIEVELEAGKTREISIPAPKRR